MPFQFNWIKNKSLLLVLSLWEGLNASIPPNVSDSLRGPLGHCILQSVCKNVFNQLKRFLLGKSCRLLIGLPLLSGSATRHPSAALRSRLSRANLKPFPYCLISIAGISRENWGTLARGISTVWTIYKTPHPPTPPPPVSWIYPSLHAKTDS